MRLTVAALCGAVVLTACTSEPQRGAASPALEACYALVELVERFDRTEQVPPHGLLPADVDPDAWRDIGEQVLERAEVIQEDDRPSVARYSRTWEAAGRYLVRATPESYDHATFQTLTHPADCSDLADSVE